MLNKKHLIALSEFRQHIRNFEDFSDRIIAGKGLTTPQYLVLLHISGVPDQDWLSVGGISTYLKVSRGVADKLTRQCEELGLVERKPDAHDQRIIQIHLTQKGKVFVNEISDYHRERIILMKDCFNIQKRLTHDSA